MHGCPLTEETITHLERLYSVDASQRWAKLRHGLTLRAPIWRTRARSARNACSARTACSAFRCFACSSRFKACQRSVAESKTACADTVTNDSSDMPFPCSQNGCFRFHSNAHAFAKSIDGVVLPHKIVPALKTGWSWLQLLMLLLAQASMENPRSMVVDVDFDVFAADRHTAFFRKTSAGFPHVSRFRCLLACLVAGFRWESASIRCNVLCWNCCSRLKRCTWEICRQQVKELTRAFSLMRMSQGLSFSRVSQICRGTLERPNG